MVGLTAAPAHATFPGPVGKIAYSDGSNLYSANADGSGAVQLTNDFANDTYPAYSPDGNYIAFMSNRRNFSGGTESDIYVMRSDGLGIHEVWGDGCSTYPGWSPDGTKLVFRTGCNNANQGIAVVNVDGTAFTQLTSGNPSNDSFPVWSPDGTKIAFSRNNTIWVMNADGTGQLRIGPPLAGCCTQAPDWSPDGSRIAFQGARACGGGCVAPDIWTVEPDGANPTRLMDTADRDEDPFWSPDGTKIAFSSCSPNPCSSPSPNDGLYVMNADGSGRSLITHAAARHGADWQAAVGPPLPPVPQQLDKIAYVSNRNNADDVWTMNPDGTRQKSLMLTSTTESEPAWSPDGTKIAFTRQDSVNLDRDIYSMNSDGTGVTNLTQDAGAWEITPAWSPDGTKIAYARQGSSDYEVWMMDSDGSGKTFLAPGRSPSWSPDGTEIAVSRDRSIYKMNADGTGAVAITTPTDNDFDDDPDWSPDGAKIAFSRSVDPDNIPNVWVVDADGSDAQQLTFSSASHGASSPSWSPDGSQIAFVQGTPFPPDIWTMGADGANQVDVTNTPVSEGDPDWYTPRGYARPKGASPLRLPLVPASVACTAPNDTHGAPLSFGSCAPPSLASQYLTTGTPDVNGRTARMNAYLLLNVVPGNSSTPADEADVQIKAHINDVANKDLSDYAGSLRARIALRLIDKDNTPAPGGAGAATTLPFSLGFDIPCTPDAATDVGSDCSVTTTADTLMPGAVNETKRTIWQSVGPVKVDDGGADGDGSTTGDNTVFLTQGLFVP